VGFGISKVEHARQAANLADGVIIGSRLIDLIDEDSTLASLKTFITSVREALDQ
ncbi:MAG: tryptophan synthase subunit alpha, partial [Dehalococcoidales bacterium]|nr:tryptophan synthase subunit alpha [Dehalococcoidales bacterium]